jgi:flagellar basal-body rod modification protein FlgD
MDRQQVDAIAFDSSKTDRRVMPLSPISASAPAAPVARTGTTNGETGLKSLDPDAFLQLLVAQMRYQDPSKPTDTTAMMQQTAAFTQVEMLTKLTTASQTSLGYAQATTAVSFIDKQVSVNDPSGSGALLEGVVDRITFTATGPQVVVATSNGDVAVGIVDVVDVRARTTPVQPSLAPYAPTPVATSP